MRTGAPFPNWAKKISVPLIRASPCRATVGRFGVGGNVSQLAEFVASEIRLASLALDSAAELTNEAPNRRLTKDWRRVTGICNGAFISIASTKMAFYCYST